MTATCFLPRGPEKNPYRIELWNNGLAMNRATESAGAPLSAESPCPSSLRETRDMLERLQLRSEDSDHHDDMRRAGDGEDGYKPSNLTRLISIAFRSGQGG